MLSLYVPGTSPVHRAPAGLKLAVLAVLGVALFATARLDLVAGALVLVVAAGLLGARLPWRVLAAQVRPVWIWLVALFGFHLLVTDPVVGAVAVLRLLTLVVAAAVVTATTRVTALVAVIEWLTSPLRVFGRAAGADRPGHRDDAAVHPAGRRPGGPHPGGPGGAAAPTGCGLRHGRAAARAGAADGDHGRRGARRPRGRRRPRPPAGGRRSGRRDRRRASPRSG